MCDEVVDNSLTALKLIPDWFVTSKTIEKLYPPFYADENILYYDEDSDTVIFLHNSNLDNNFDEDDPHTIIYILSYILLIYYKTFGLAYKFEKRKALKKDLKKELIEIAWYPKRSWNFRMSEIIKK